MRTALIVVAALCTVAVAAEPSKPEALEVKAGEIYYGVRAAPGFDVVGRYEYKSADRKPWIILNADGSGVFQTHEKKDIAIQWWLESDASGEVKTQKGDIARRHMLIVRYSDASYKPKGSFDFFGMTVRTDMKKVFILGEREKPL